MQKKITALNKTYKVEWTPDAVCKLLKSNFITANTLVQFNKINTNKLIRELFLLACKASLNSSDNNYEKANLLSNYAKNIRKISDDYEKLFRRSGMKETVPIDRHDNERTEDSVIENIDRMQARLFYLTTQFSIHPCTHLAGQIVELLNHLCRHPHIEMLPAQRYIYSQSLNYWRSRLITNSKLGNQKVLH